MNSHYKRSNKSFVPFYSATNPNNWHWKEKNATQWSKDKLNELLVGLKVEDEQFICEVKELKKCDGEASANNRKAKLVFLVRKRLQYVHTNESIF